MKNDVLRFQFRNIRNEFERERKREKTKQNKINDKMFEMSSRSINCLKLRI